MTTEVGVANLAIHQQLVDTSDVIEPRRDIELKGLRRFFDADKAKSNCIVGRQGL